MRTVSPIHVEFEPGLQWIRRQRMVEAGYAVKVVIGLLYIFAMETGFGYLGVERDGDFELRGLALVGLTAPFRVRGVGDVPVAGAGRFHGDVLDLDGHGSRDW